MNTIENLNEIIEQLYEEFCCFGYNKKVFRDLVYEYLTNSTNENDDYYSSLKQYLYSVIIKKIENNDITPITFFVKNKFIDITDYESALNNIEIFKKIIVELNITLSNDFIIQLLNNSKILKETVKKIIVSNKELLGKIEICEIFSDELIINLVTLYRQNYNDKTIQKGKKSTSKFDYDEQLQLIALAQTGDKNACEQLIKQNYRLIQKCANKYRNKEVEFEDLVQEGCLGFIKGLQKFDFSKGTKMSTYCVWWINQAIERFVQDSSKTIRIPVHKMEKLNKLRKTINELKKIYGREPFVYEIADTLGISVEETDELIKLSINSNTVSLNQKISDESENELGDFIPSNEKVEEVVDANLVKLDVRSLVDSALEPREKSIIILLFGINGEKPKTLEEVGKVYGLTRERVRQIKEKALRKLRKKSKSYIKFSIPESSINKTNEKKESKYPVVQKTSNYVNNLLDSSLTAEEGALKFHITPGEVLKIQNNALEKIRDKKNVFDFTKNKSNDKLSSEHINTQIKDEDKQVTESIHKTTDTPSSKTGETLYTKSQVDEVETTELNELLKKNQKDELQVETINTPPGTVKVNGETKKEEREKKPMSKKGRKVKSLYAIFSDYSKEEIDKVISELELEEIELLKFRYGEDFVSPPPNVKLTSQQKNKIYGHIFTKMRKISGNSKVKDNKKDSNGENFNGPTGEDKETSNNLQGIPNGNNTLENTKLSPSSEGVDANDIITNSTKLTKEDYYKTLELLRTPTFGEIFTELGAKDAVIISLILGYVDNTYFEPTAVATFLGITVEEVNESVKNVLIVYRNHINELIENARNAILGQPKIYEKGQ